jgi:hypothetical protein
MASYPFWFALVCQIVIVIGYFWFYRKEQLCTSSLPSIPILLTRILSATIINCSTETTSPMLLILASSAWNTSWLHIIMGNFLGLVSLLSGLFLYFPRAVARSYSLLLLVIDATQHNSLDKSIGLQVLQPLCDACPRVNKPEELAYVQGNKIIRRMQHAGSKLFEASNPRTLL